MRLTLRSLALAALVLAAAPLSAQYYYLPSTVNGNPGGLNTDAEYPVGGGLATSWTTISTAPAATPAWSSTQTLPFGFNFNGSAVTQYKVSTSGVLTFDVTATTPPGYTKAALPDASIPNNSVCIWGLASVGTNDLIVNKTFGTAPNRQHWVMFSSYGQVGSTCWTYWAIVLEESTNKIYLVDQRNSCTGATLSLGIQVNSTTAYSVAGSPSVAIQAGTDATAADKAGTPITASNAREGRLIEARDITAKRVALLVALMRDALGKVAPAGATFGVLDVRAGKLHTCGQPAVLDRASAVLRADGMAYAALWGMA